MKALNQFLNENYESETLEMLQNRFIIKIEPKKINVEQSDDEYLIFDIQMSNGDKVEYYSFKTISPNPSDIKKNNTEMSINGKKVKMTNLEIEEGLEGAFAAYKRIQKL